MHGINCELILGNGQEGSLIKISLSPSQGARPEDTCTSTFEFNTAGLQGVDLEHLPIVDLLPPLPQCQQGSCQIELGPLCFTQDSYLTSGG